jgi:hypothetical protein
MTLDFKESAIAMFLNPREMMVAPFDLGNDWTEIRCGAFISGCSPIVYLNCVDNNVGFMTNTPQDSISFGIKNSDNFTIPGEAGSLYLGIRTTSATPFGNQTILHAYNISSFPPVGTSQIGNGLLRVHATGYDGTTLVDGGEIRSDSSPTGSIKFRDFSAGQGYCGLYIIKFVITGRGTAAQSVTMSISQKAEVDGFDYSPFALKQEMNNATFGPEVTIPWNSGGAPRDIPDAFYVRMPFYHARIMLASMRVIKYQPE